MKTCETVLNFS